MRLQACWCSYSEIIGWNPPPRSCFHFAVACLLRAGIGDGHGSVEQFGGTVVPEAGSGYRNAGGDVDRELVQSLPHGDACRRQCTGVIVERVRILDERPGDGRGEIRLSGLGEGVKILEVLHPIANQLQPHTGHRYWYGSADNVNGSRIVERSVAIAAGGVQVAPRTWSPLLDERGE